MTFTEPLLSNMSMEEKANYGAPISAAEVVAEQDRHDELYSDGYNEGFTTALLGVFDCIENQDKKLDRDELITLIRKEV